MSILRVPAWPQIKSEDESAVLEVVRSGCWWSKEGTKVTEFERRFAAHHGCEHGIAMTNGTHAIVAALRAAGVGPGDEVVIPDFTFISTASAVLEVGARPVLIDVDRDTYNISAETLARGLTPSTRAVILVHMAGELCDMRALADVVRGRNIVIIEDAAHAHGARTPRFRVGELSFAAIFSFQQYKLMTAGEGGMITTNSSPVAERLRLIANVGRPFPDPTYQYQILGSNYRMTEFQAALLLAQLDRLDDLARLRMRNAALLRALVGSGRVRVQAEIKEQEIHPYYMLMLSCRGRNEAVTRLRARGLPVSYAFAPLHRSQVLADAYRHAGRRVPTDEDLPVSSDIGDHVLWLHHRVLLGDEAFTRALVAAINEDCNAV